MLHAWDERIANSSQPFCVVFCIVGNRLCIHTQYMPHLWVKQIDLKQIIDRGKNRKRKHSFMHHVADILFYKIQLLTSTLVSRNSYLTELQLHTTHNLYIVHKTGKLLAACYFPWPFPGSKLPNCQQMMCFFFRSVARVNFLGGTGPKKSGPFGPKKWNFWTSPP